MFLSGKCDYLNRKYNNYSLNFLDGFRDHSILTFTEHQDGNMRIKTLFLVIFVFLSVFYCDKKWSPFYNGDDGEDYIDPDYPTVIYALPATELNTLQQEFNTLNHSSIQNKLNQFGYVGKTDRMKMHANPGIPIDRTEALRIAVECMLKNAKFTNVRDSLDYVNNIDEIIPLETDSTKWRIIAKPQMYNGVEICGPRIRAFVYGDGVYRLQGFWYQHIHIPHKENITPNEAKEIVTGDTIIWHDIAGRPVEFIVTGNTIGVPIRKTIFPLETSDSITLHVTWEVPILFFPSDSDVFWHMYVDIMTGEVIRIIQEFRT